MNSKKWLVSVALSLACVSAARGQGQPTSEAKTNAYGGRIRVSVENKPADYTLSEDDLQALSMLGGHLLRKIEFARRALDGSDSGNAHAAILKANEVCEILLGMLPKTNVTIEVKDSSGKVLYRDREDSQPERQVASGPLCQHGIDRAA